MEEKIAIKVEHVSKSFVLPHERHNSVKNQLFSLFRGNKKRYEKQDVLKDISFEVSKGDFFGIVGRNGSGKSTLLKLLAGIYEPGAGAIHVNGKLTPFIELGVGFNYDLTGRENVFLNGALLGFSRQEMLEMYDRIVEFAELEDFMDQKLKNYSSGMQVRLAFSIAIRVNTDILVLDEVLAVGDAAFQQKCYETFAELKKKGVTIILVTHDMNSVLRFCNRAIMLHEGQITEQGKPGDVADAYLKLNFNQQEQPPVQKDGEVNNSVPRISGVALANGRGGRTQFDPGDSTEVQLTYVNPPDQQLHFGVQIYSEADVYCFGTNTLLDGHTTKSGVKGSVKMKLKLDLVPGNYYVTAGVLNENATTLIHYKSKAVKFRIRKTTQQDGVALLDHSWEFKDV